LLEFFSSLSRPSLAILAKLNNIEHRRTGVLPLRENAITFLDASKEWQKRISHQIGSPAAPTLSFFLLFLSVAVSHFFSRLWRMKRLQKRETLVSVVVVSWLDIRPQNFLSLGCPRGRRSTGTDGA